MTENKYKVTKYFYYSVFGILACSIINGYNFSMDAVTSALRAKGGEGTDAAAGKAMSLRFNEDFQIPESVFGVVTAIHTAGSLLATVLLFKAAMSMGRKTMLFASTGASIAGSLIMANAGSALVFSAGRCVCGVGHGIGCLVVPSYLAEISPATLQMKISSIYPFGTIFGSIIAQVAGGVFGNEERWRMFFYFSAGLSLCYAGLLLPCPESPVFCELRGMFVRARDISRLLYTERKIQKKPIPMYKRKDFTLSTNPFIVDETEGNIIVDDGDTQESDIDTQADVDCGADTELRSIITCDEEKQKKKKTFVEKFVSREHRKDVFVGVVIHMAQQFSGINILFCFSQNIFSVFKNEARAKTYSLALNAVYPAGLLLYILFGTRYQKKTFLLLSIFLVSVFIFSFSASFFLEKETGVYLSAVFISFTYSLGLAAIPWTFPSDLFHKEDVFSFSLFFTFVNIFVQLLLLVFYPPLMEAVGNAVLFLFFFFFSAASFAAIALLYRRKASEEVLFSKLDQKQ
ncbi:MAG: major facilitator superfamily transporter, sugar porter (SP) family [Amphiamblys sp. WSBS2006]|nr:MAG: major facilitator superfamily transporter, sugar porter (SP) family [Amphiamblys sp. WSBS2006]